MVEKPLNEDMASITLTSASSTEAWEDAVRGNFVKETSARPLIGIHRKDRLLMTNHPKHKIIWVKIEAPPEQDISSLLEQDLALLLDPVELEGDPALSSPSYLIWDAFRSTATNSYMVIGISGIARVRAITVRLSQ